MTLLRTLAKSKGFTTTAVLTLALGIGANTAVFSVVNGVLLRPLPYPTPDRITMLFTRMTGLGVEHGNLSAAELMDVATRSHAFASVGVYRNYQRGGTITGACGQVACEPLRIDALPVTASVFPILGASAAQGHVFGSDEDRPGHDRVIVLSDAFWHARFGGDPNILGRAIILDGLPRVVIGVMPSDFTFQRADAYLPLALDSLEAHRGAHSYIGLARLQPGATVAQANADLSALATQLAVEHARAYPRQMGFSLYVQAMHEYVVRNVRTSLLVLWGVVALVLLMCCVNIANLTVARSQARRRELAVRAALGANRSRLIRQVLAESLVLSLAGGALGALLAPLAVRALLAISPGGLPRAENVEIDGAVLAVTLVLAVLTGLMFGILPALQAAKADLGTAMRDDARGASGGRSAQRTKRTLIVAEVALAVVVLCGAGLVLQSFWRLIRVDSGFQPDHVVTLSLKLPAATYSDALTPDRLYGQLTERLNTLPGVRATAIARTLPTDGSDNWDIEIEGRPIAPGEAAPSPTLQFTTPGYFAALRIPLRAGRLLTDADDGRTGFSAVVNETMARQFWPGGALGHRFRIKANPDQAPEPWLTIVGVVADARMEGPSQLAPPQWIATTSEMARTGESLRDMWLFIRTASDPTAIVPAARHELWALDRNLNFGQIQTMTAVMAGATAGPRSTALLLACFGGVATMLAAIGVYGVLAYSVTQRRRELGIRLALGARASDIAALVVSQGLRLAAIGVVLGLLGAIALSRVLESLLFETPARDPLTFATIATLFLAVAAAASWLPARRAAALDPVTTLREG
jgi:predicted permease